jgi:hypothetical protein
LKIARFTFKNHEDVFLQNFMEEVLKRIISPREGERMKMEASGLTKSP